MVDVFFSYKREERERIAPIITALTAEGFDVWSDSKMLVTANIIKEVNARLREARCIVVAWSSLSVQSDWVLDEAYDGFIRRCLVPLRIDNVAIPIPFARIETLDLSKWKGDRELHDWRRLVAAVQYFRRAEISQPPIAQRPVGSETEAEDEEDSQSEPTTAGDEHVPPDSRELPETDRARELIMAALAKSSKPVSCSSLAHMVHIAMAKSVGRGNWFGFKSFNDFLSSLDIPGYALEKVPHSQLRRVEGAQREPAASKPVVAQPKAAANIGPAPPAPTGIDGAEVGFEQKLFALLEMPRLDPLEFRSVFRAIASVIKAGRKDIGPITTAARDELRAKGSAIGRNRIKAVVRGALFGGLQLDQAALMSGGQVGYAFASSIYRKCAARDWELSVEDCGQVHRLLGLEEES